MAFHTRTSRRHRNPHTHESQEQQKPFFSKASDTAVQAKDDGAFFQPKLTIGQPGDKYEQEADAMADSVINNQNGAPQVQEKKISAIQKQDMSEMEEDKAVQEKPEVQQMEEEEEPIQAQAEEEEQSVQMQSEEEESVQMQEEEEEPVQTKSVTGQSKVANSKLSQKIHQSAGNGRALPKQTRAEMESAFGTDFSGVHIHTGQDAVQMNKELGAQAFTHGKDVYFNSGKYNPETRQGKHLLAHELTHVVQQGKTNKEKIDRNGEDGLTSAHFLKNNIKAEESGYSLNQQEYGKKCLDVVREAVKMLKDADGIEKVIDYLAEKRQEMATTPDKSKSDFGEKREPGKKKKVARPSTAMANKYGGKYIDKTIVEPKLKERKERIGSDVVDESENESELKKYTVKADLNGEIVPLTSFTFFENPKGFLQNTWTHTHVDQVQKILGHIYDLSDSLKKAEESEVIPIVAKIHWWMAQAMPWYRGSAAIAHMLATTLLVHKDFVVSKRKEKVFIDLEAFILSLDDFVAKYGEFFEQPPQKKEEKASAASAVSSSSAIKKKVKKKKKKLIR